MSKTLHKYTFEECEAYANSIQSEIMDTNDFKELQKRCWKNGISIQFSYKYSHSEDGYKGNLFEEKTGKIGLGLVMIGQIDLVKDGEILFTKDEEGFPLQMTVTYTLIKHMSSLFLPSFKQYSVDNILENEIPIETLEEMLDIADEKGFDTYGYQSNSSITCDEINVQVSNQKFDGCVKIESLNGCIYLSKDAFLPVEFSVWSTLGFQKFDCIQISQDKVGAFEESLSSYHSKLFKYTFSDYLSSVYEECPIELTPMLEKRLNRILFENSDQFREVLNRVYELLDGSEIKIVKYGN